LGEKIRPANLFGFGLKNINEQPANNLALAFRIRDACELAKEEV